MTFNNNSIYLITIIFIFINIIFAYDGIATTTIIYSGSIPNCNTPCNVSEQFTNLSCEGDSSWESGARKFPDPIPQGYRAEAINITLYLNIGCTDFTGKDALITVGGAIVKLFPEIIVNSDCACDTCMQTIQLVGNSYPDGWPNYNYGGFTVLKIWFNSFICVSNVTLDIGYVTPSPKLITFHPSSAPLNTIVTVLVIGTDFISSNQLFCSFGGQLVNATFIDSTQLTCVAPSSSSPSSVEFQVVDGLSIILDGGRFFWYVNPTITSISPTSGPFSGTNVTLFGSNFFTSQTAICKFGTSPTIAIDFIDTNTIICIDVSNNNNNPVEVAVSFSENANNYVFSPQNYTFTSDITKTSSVTPTRTPSKASSSSITSTKSNSKSKTSSRSKSETPTNSNSKKTIISSTPSETNSEGILPPFAWAAIAVTILIICILIAGVFSIFYQNYKKKGRGYSVVSSSDGLSTRELSSNALMDPNTIPVSELKNLKQIEKGSFGVIYEATWRGTKIAVKKLPTTMTEKQLLEFYQEAALMKSLRHPNILQYLGISHAEKDVCICMEFMQQGSLYRLLHNPNSKFSLDKIKSICLDTVRGMNYLHQQQPPIVHRDLKSHNLLVDGHWRVKVCDFGLSRITAQNQTMTACGTPSWTAPEVLRNERYTTKADVYGFGIVVWEMFARSDPFPEMPPFQIVFAVGTQKLRPQVDPNWPIQWVNLMTTCWNEDPHARPTFEEIITVLENMSDP